MGLVKVIAVIINNNQKEITLNRLMKLGAMKKVEEICLIESGCVNAETMKTDLNRFKKIGYYLNLEQGVTLSEMRNLALAQMKSANYDWLWFVAGEPTWPGIPKAAVGINRGGMIIKKNAVRAVGGFENRFYEGLEEFDWVFRAKQKGFMVAGEVKEAGTSSGLKAYFWGRNPWLMIRIRLKRRWWTKEGRMIMGYWLKLLRKGLVSPKPGNQKMFWRGTLDGWKILL